MAKQKSTHLSVMGLGLGMGIYWGLSMIISGWMAMFDWGNQFVSTMASIYIGFEPSFIGSIVGGIWGFGDGFIGGIIVAAFYNLFRK